MPKKIAPQTSPDRSKPVALIYARVSSKEQEKEGFSIPAQLKLLHAYAAQQSLKVAEEFVDVETAKATGPHQLREIGPLCEIAPRGVRRAIRRAVRARRRRR